jgi:hypothetical protein
MINVLSAPTAIALIMVTNQKEASKPVCGNLPAGTLGPPRYISSFGGVLGRKFASPDSNCQFHYRRALWTVHGRGLFSWVSASKNEQTRKVGAFG